MANTTEINVKEVVQKRYGELARSVGKGGSCCAPS